MFTGLVIWVRENKPHFTTKLTDVTPNTHTYDNTTLLPAGLQLTQTLHFPPTLQPKAILPTKSILDIGEKKSRPYRVQGITPAPAPGSALAPPPAATAALFCGGRHRDTEVKDDHVDVAFVYQGVLLPGRHVHARAGSQLFSFRALTRGERTRASSTPGSTSVCQQTKHM